jgi:probable phosphoglycerate mutase
VSLLNATLYFVRHGETDWNREARLQGQRDVDLNATGRVQADESGRRLAGLLPDLLDPDYVASPLRRTRDTMELMRGALGLPPKEYRIDERLKELTFGRWEGSTWREIRARDAASATRREREKWDFVPPEGESYAMLADRLRPVVAEIDRDTVLVSHGGVARALLTLLAGVPQHEAPRIDIWQGKVLVIESGRYRWA